MTTRHSPHYGGRKLEEFLFTYGEIKKQIEVRAHGNLGDLMFHAGDKDLGIHVQSQNPNEIPALFREAFARLVAKEWELHVWVTIRTDEVLGQRAVGLDHKFVAIGRTNDGAMVHAGAKLKLLDVPERARAGIEEQDGDMPKPIRWEGDWEVVGHVSPGEPPAPDDDGRRFKDTSFDFGKPHEVLVRGTLENVNAILLFEWELRNVAHRMREFFSTTERAEQTLALIARGKLPQALLPASHGTGQPGDD